MRRRVLVSGLSYVSRDWDDTRSLCTTTCKWKYLAHENAERGSGWDESYFSSIGLAELADEGFARIGTRVRPMGERIGGLTARAAEELGLAEGTAVGVSIIDAHAGVLAAGAVVDGKRRCGALEPGCADLGTRAAYGLFACSFIRRGSGPYSRDVPDLWRLKAGQSSTWRDRSCYRFACARIELRMQASAGHYAYAISRSLDELLRRWRFCGAHARAAFLPYLQTGARGRIQPARMISGLKLSNTLTR